MRRCSACPRNACRPSCKQRHVVTGSLIIGLARNDHSPFGKSYQRKGCWAEIVEETDEKFGSFYMFGSKRWKTISRKEFANKKEMNAWIKKEGITTFKVI